MASQDHNELDLTDPELKDVSSWITYTCYEPREVASDSDDESASEDGESGTLGAVVLDLRTLWNVGETVNYCFLAGKYQGTAVQHKKVAKVVLEWEKYAHIHFKEVDDQTATIRITFNARSGAWANPGTTANDVKEGAATMNLGPVKADDEEPTDLEKGYILHEFGHAIGLGHEHQSPFMDGEMKVGPITRYYKSFFKMNDKWITTNITGIYKREELSSYSAFDPKSIMIYPMPPQMFTEGALQRYPSLGGSAYDKPLIYPCLSDTDIAFAIINYPYDEPRAGWSYEKALRVAGVDEEPLLLKLLGFWKEKNYTQMRNTFRLWNLGKQSELGEQLRVEIEAEMEKFEAEERAKIAAELDPKKKQQAEFTLKERLAEYRTYLLRNAAVTYSEIRAKAIAAAVSVRDTLFGRFSSSK